MSQTTVNNQIENIDFGINFGMNNLTIINYRGTYLTGGHKQSQGNQNDIISCNQQ